MLSMYQQITVKTLRKQGEAIRGGFAIELKLNKKRILRVMKKFGIKPYRRRVKRLRKKRDERRPVAPYMNVVKLLCPIASFVV